MTDRPDPNRELSPTSPPAEAAASSGPSVWTRLWRALTGTGPTSRSAHQAATFRLQYERFREILSINDRTLELIADIDDMLGAEGEIDLEEVSARLRRATMDVFVMVKNLNLIAGDRHAALYEALRRVNAALEEELPPSHDAEPVALVRPIAELQRSDRRVAGGKMVALAEVARAGERIPPGFVITTSAFAQFLQHAALSSEVGRLAMLVDRGDERALGRACAALQAAIMSAEPPEPIRQAIEQAFDQLPPDEAGRPRLVAVRSSAVGEDEAASHAGQYQTVLAVERADLLAAYRRVVASAFAPAPVAYRRGQGESVARTLMAVGVLGMVEPRWSGVLFTRHFARPDADELVLSATRGLADALVAGAERGEEVVFDAAGRVVSGTPGPLGDELAGLAQMARRVEAHFKQPLDIEWAIDRAGDLHVLQARPMRFAPSPLGDAPTIGEGVAPIVVGGITACPGAASGTVVRVESEEELAAVPDGAVVVARHSAPWFSRIMPRIAAIVTEVGSPVGHMAIIARELDLPCIVGLRNALATMREGTLVTVDAFRCRVLPGALPVPPRAVRGATGDAGHPDRVRLRRIAARVSPLRLTNPSSPEFTPSGCQSLHDITRFVHEKVFGVMFHFGDIAESDRDNAVRLDAALPFKVLVYDVGGGLEPTAALAGAVEPGQVLSFPLRAFLGGLLDTRIVWNQPRPVSGRGFLSVLGESMAGPPPDVQRIGRTSYAVISDRYMNFSTKAGYHFSTVDTYCGASLNKNYIHFRFAGGAARSDRRERRVRFLQMVLDALDFGTRPRGDILVARLEKYEREVVEERLRALGRLTMVTRQLDMLMDSDSSPSFFARAFLEDRLESF